MRVMKTDFLRKSFGSRFTNLDAVATDPKGPVKVSMVC